MIYTARQLEQLHKANGQILLPYRARLTPMAQDWVRAKRITLGYSDEGNPSLEASAPVKQADATGKFLWWCDGPCGPAKAALSTQARETALIPIAIVAEAKQLANVVKFLAREIKDGRALGGVLMVQYGASAMIYANRCPSLRAVLGTCLEAVEQGMQQVAANVLVIEYSYKSIHQVQSILGRFVKAKRKLSDEVARQLQELSTCA